MKNTKQNRLKFMAQYFMQDLILGPGESKFPMKFEGIDCIGNVVCRDEGINLSVHHRADHVALLLKPMSLITKRDLVLLQFRMGKGTKIVFNGIEWVGYDSRGFQLCHGTLLPENVDYLRQNGFAVSWNGLSVDAQVKYGWVKLIGS